MPRTEPDRPARLGAVVGQASTAAPPWARWWRGRFGYPMLLELLLVAALLTLYRYGRYLAREQTGQAFVNAREILQFEERLGIGNEAAIQRQVLDHRWLIGLLNRYYVSVHFPVTVLFLVVTYVRAPDGYRRIRRLFVGVTAMALAIHVVFPLAPPRMMPGFVDTVTRFGPAVYQRSDVADTVNQFAAMPSLHFGWAVLVAFGVITLTRSPWRWLIVAHPLMVLISIVVTANHYWLDAIVAGLLVLFALAAAWVLTPRDPELRSSTWPDQGDLA